MRLNKSFIVERTAEGLRAQYRAITRTSRYIRFSFEEDVSVWIAQRQGRAKDGFDRTDPALLKMLMLAYRSADDPLASMLANATIVPVSISYELDPCGLLKANELAVRATGQAYQKDPEEDLRSIITGVSGFKGRIHLAFAKPIEAARDLTDLATQLDHAIVSAYKLFPTHYYAKALVAGDDGVELENSVALSRLQEEVATSNAAIRPYLLAQYANIFRNREELGID